MHLVQILLPLRRNDGSAQPASLFRQVRAELVQRFGGITAFSRAPAEGLWDEGETVAQDQLILVEVMDVSLDRGWWAEYRRRLERRFEQKELVVRALSLERL